MSSTIQMWGTIHFPPGALDDWLGSELDGGRAVDDDAESYAPYFEDEHRVSTVGAALGRVDEIGEWFGRFEVEDDEVRFRGAFGDEWWAEWLALIGGIARAAAAGGGHGVLELVDDGTFVGRLRVDAAGAAWVAAARNEEPADDEGARRTGALLDEVLAGK